MTDHQPPAIHANMTGQQVDDFLNWAAAENDRLEAQLDHARELLDDLHAGCYQPHRNADGEYADCDGRPI